MKNGFQSHTTDLRPFRLVLHVGEYSLTPKTKCLGFQDVLSGVAYIIGLKLGYQGTLAFTTLFSNFSSGFPVSGRESLP